MNIYELVVLIGKLIAICHSDSVIGGDMNETKQSSNIVKKDNNNNTSDLILTFNNY